MKGIQSKVNPGNPHTHDSMISKSKYNLGTMSQELLRVKMGK